MSIIYRLIDEAEKADIQKNNRISLSRQLLKYRRARRFNC